MRNKTKEWCEPPFPKVSGPHPTSIHQLSPSHDIEIFGDDGRNSRGDDRGGSRW